MSRSAVVAIAGLMALSSLTPIAVSAKTPAGVRHLHFAVVAEVNGRYADWRCDQGDSKRALLPKLVGSIRKRRSVLRGQGKALTTIVTGDFVGASSVARHVLASSEADIADLASALTRTDTMMYVVGNGELAHAPEHVNRYAAALGSAGVPFGSVNLACDASRSALCEAGGGRQVINIDGVKVGFFGLQYDELVNRVSKASLRGLTWQDPAEQTVKALQQVAEQKVELKVGVIHRGSHGSPEADLTQMAEALQGWVQLLITDAVAEDATVPRLTQVGVGAKSVQVLSVPGGKRLWYEVRIDISPGGKVTLGEVVTHTIGDSSPNDPQIGRWMNRMRDQFCGRWDQRTGGVKLGQAMSASDFVLLTLHVLRSAGQGDVAVINGGAFDLSQNFPIRGRLNRRVLFDLLRFKNKIVTITVDGDELQELIDADPGPDEGKKDLHWVGVKETDDGVTVNGRPIVSRMKYKLVTIDFLANGGDETFLPFTDGKTVGNGATLRSHVERWIAKRPAKPLGDPADEFDDFWDKPLWKFTVQGRVDFNSIQYANAPGYIDPQLTNLDFRQLDIAIDSSLNMNTRDHGWIGRFILNYSETRGVDRSEGVSVPYRLVNTDLAQADMTYQYRHLRDSVLKRAWWAPIPIVYGRARTELDVPPGQRYRWADVDGLVGLGWEPIGSLRVRLGAGLNRELLRTMPGPYLRPMLHFGYLLPQQAIAKLGSGQVLLQLEADVRVKGIGGDQRETYHLDNTVLAPLWGPLKAYLQLEYFAMRAKGPLNDFGAPARANEWTQQMRVSVGLALTLLKGLQLR